MMTPGLTFWIIAWSMMGIAFLAAFLAITIGAKGLDRCAGELPEVPTPKGQDN